MASRTALDLGSLARMLRGAALDGVAGLTLAACATVGPRGGGGGDQNGTMRPYQVRGVWYTPRYQPDYDEVGLATWYGPESPNHRTADGEAFAMNIPSAAHKTLPLPCVVEVTDLDTGRRIRVRVNDRGPFVAGRIIDLSPQAARDLGMMSRGSARVRVRFLASASGTSPQPVFATAQPPLPTTVRVSGPPWLAAQEPTPPPIVVLVPADAATSAPPAYRIRAAAFADRGNAVRAVAVLSAQGYAFIETITVDGAKLYRVEVDCPADVAPETVRQHVIAAGFPGARLIDPS